MGMCLFNLPEVKQAFGGRKCGNGYVEEGEECDCGEPEVRSHLHSACLVLQAGRWIRKCGQQNEHANNGWQGIGDGADGKVLAMRTYT